MLPNVHSIKAKHNKISDSEITQVFESELDIMIGTNEEFTIEENLEKRLVISEPEENRQLL